MEQSVQSVEQKETSAINLYKWHKRVHGIKSQSVAAPNRLITNLFGPVERWRHDSAMSARSGLLPNVRALFHSPRWIYTVHLWRFDIPVEATTPKAISASTDNSPSIKQ